MSIELSEYKEHYGMTHEQLMYAYHNLHVDDYKELLAIRMKWLKEMKE